jgi:hypothetical protein
MRLPKWYLVALWIGLLLCAWAVRTHAQSSVLQASDFTPVLNAAGQPCYYDVKVNGQNSTYQQGLTGRRIGGDLRFLTIQLGGTVMEFSLAGKNCGDMITATTNQWETATLPIHADWMGISWDDPHQRLLWTDGSDYTATTYPAEIFTLQLNSDGSVSDLHGPVQLSGINTKRTYGGAAAVPAAFQAAYGVGPYVMGFGGYTSLVNQGGGASMGLTMYSIPYPGTAPVNAPLSQGSNVATQFAVLADHISGGSSTDWYASGAPAAFDRGAMLTNHINYYDGGDPRQNPPADSPPTGPPQAGAQWLSPSPDGTARMTWGDSYYNTCNWISGERSGVACVLDACGGKCWYGSSTLHSDYRVSEIHVFAEADLGAAAQGSKNAWNVQPATMKVISPLPGCNAIGGPGNWGNSTVGAVSAAWYDATTQLFYLIAPGCGADVYTVRMYVYSVNTGGSTPPPPPPPMTFPLTVTASSLGTVTSTPSGIACPAACSASFAQGATVTLTPTASAGASFAGWSGACTGTGACVVTMTAATSVTASFVANAPPPPPLSAPAPTTVSVTCSRTFQAKAPDTRTGWRAQYQIDGVNAGSSTNNAPYTRTLTITGVNRSVTVQWTKSGQPNVISAAAQVSCQ